MQTKQINTQDESGDTGWNYLHLELRIIKHCTKTQCVLFQVLTWQSEHQY